MDNQQQLKNNLNQFLTDARVVHMVKKFFNVYPQLYTTQSAKLEHALKGLSTENQAFNYDYYFLKV